MYWYKNLGIDTSSIQPINILKNDYIIANSILRQKNIYSPSQNQTKDAFGFKWSKRDTYESESFKENSRRWLVERYVDGNGSSIEDYLPKGSRVLDAGCGSSYSALLLFPHLMNGIHYLGVDISSAVDVAKQRFSELGLSGEFLQADLLNLPFDKPTFDVIFSEGVLHHTDSTERAIKYLSKLIVPGGLFLFYVYNKKGPIREFTDDYIRNYLKDLPDQDAWNDLMPLTELGKTLGELNLKIRVPQDIPFLNISAGEIDIQRLFYWNVFKAYFRSDLTIEEMNHINFDWFRPLNCHRQTPEEVRKWCTEAGLIINKIKIEEAGITIIARKQ